MTDRATALNHRWLDWQERLLLLLEAIEEAGEDAERRRRIGEGVRRAAQERRERTAA